MGRMKFNIDGGAEAEANTGGVGYSGPLPPAGAYRFRLKRMELVMNGSGNPMFKILLEIAERKGSKNAKYNGCGIWHNLNVTDQSKGYVNGFLDALAGPSQVAQKKMRRAFWETGIVTEGKTDLGHVIKIGTTKVNSPDGELMIAGSIKKKKPYTKKDGTRVEDPEELGMEINTFLVALSGESDASDEDEAEDEDIEEDEDVDEDEEDDEDEDEDDEEEDEDEEDGDDEDDDPDYDDADDEDDDGEDEEDDDEEEEEEPPVKKPVRKRTTAAKRGRDAF